MKSSKLCQYLELILIIRSTPYNFQRRQELRHLFRDESLKSYGFRYDFVFFMGRSENRELQEMKNLENELLEYGDLVIANFVESSISQTSKILQIFQWVAAFCQYSKPILMIIDDNIPLALESFIPVLSDACAPTRQKFYHGIVASNQDVVRYSEPTVTSRSMALGKEIIPWTVHAPFLKGGLALFGFPIVQKISIGMLFTKMFPLEDAYIGLVATRMGMRPENITKYVQPKDMLTNRSHSLYSYGEPFTI